MNTGLLAKQRLEMADKDLNATYSRVLDTLPADELDEHPRRSLIEAQRQWFKWRDAECASVGESNGGVRMWKSAYTMMCLADMTEARTSDLNKQFESER